VPLLNLQRVLVFVGRATAAILFVGGILDSFISARTLIRPGVTYVGTIALLLGTAILQFWVARFRVSWQTNGQSSRVTSLNATWFASVLGLIGLLWVPRVADYYLQPVDRTLVHWSERLWNGQRLLLEIGDLPPHARGLLVEGALYSVSFRNDVCEWLAEGPINHPTAGLVEHHSARGGPHVKPYLSLESSGTQGECAEPRGRDGQGRAIVMSTIIDFDRRGNVSFGGEHIRIGAFRVP
jgi:hypothetical protein